MYKSYLNHGTYYFKSWPEIYENANIFDSDGSIHYDESIQGGAGTCYLMAALGSLGEFEPLVKNMFVTQEVNSIGATAVRFYIRGKPWVVTVDNELLFKYQRSPETVFASPADDQNAMWAAILEKAWAKVKGNYLNADGGLMENGLHAVVGVPVFRYETAAITNEAQAEEAYQLLLAADAANYIMGAGTAGYGND